MLWADFKQKRSPGTEPDDKIARILCCMPDTRKFDYKNITDCSAAYKYFGSNSYCPEGCIGLLSCVRACPKGAIKENLEVDPDRCDGCGVCMEPCPLDLIVLTSPDEEVFVGCSTSLHTDKVKESCINGCLKCYICLDVCSQRAISIDKNGMPVIDYLKCDSCIKCVRKCPAGTIKRVDYRHKTRD